MPRKGWKLSNALREYRSPLFTRRGRADGKTRKPESDAAPEAPSDSELAPSTSDMSATATVETKTPWPSPESIFYAETTPPDSSVSMAWQMSPIGLSERGWPTSIDPTSAVKALGEPHSTKLTNLAHGRSEPVERTIEAIVNYFVLEQDARAEMPVGELVKWYLDNYVMA